MPQQKNCRRRYRFSGTVQGVGFRYRARCTAELYDLTGWVENEPDGSVTLELQGPAEKLDRVIETICRGSAWIEIAQVETTERAVLPHELGFSVRGW